MIRYIVIQWLTTATFNLISGAFYRFQKWNPIINLENSYHEFPLEGIRPALHILHMVRQLLDLYRQFQRAFIAIDIEVCILIRIVLLRKFRQSCGLTFGCMVSLVLMTLGPWRGAVLNTDSHGFVRVFHCDGRAGQTRILAIWTKTWCTNVEYTEVGLGFADTL